MGPGGEAGVGMGPLVNAAARDRVLSYIDQGEKSGADLVLDGREAEMPAAGCFVGPTIFDRATTEMSIVREEIFGPVLSIMRSPTLEDAIEMANRSEYGNMAVIFTDSGHAARRFSRGIKAGMQGVNVGVPAPMAVFPFSGWKGSFFGDLHANGEDAAKFYTESRVLVTRWI